MCTEISAHEQYLPSQYCWRPQQESSPEHQAWQLALMRKSQENTLCLLQSGKATPDGLTNNLFLKPIYFVPAI